MLAGPNHVRVGYPAQFAFYGKRSAHEMKAHSIQEISTTLDIVEILLQNVYVLPRLAEVLPANKFVQTDERTHAADACR